ncbi:uncharacterized protein LOC144440050 isoform X2 [Glandiceps talaboti]
MTAEGSSDTLTASGRIIAHNPHLLFEGSPQRNTDPNTDQEPDDEGKSTLLSRRRTPVKSYDAYRMSGEYDDDDRDPMIEDSLDLKLTERFENVDDSGIQRDSLDGSGVDKSNNFNEQENLDPNMQPDDPAETMDVDQNSPSKDNVAFFEERGRQGSHESRRGSAQRSDPSPGTQSKGSGNSRNGSGNSSGLPPRGPSAGKRGKSGIGNGSPGSRQGSRGGSAPRGPQESFPGGRQGSSRSRSGSRLPQSNPGSRHGSGNQERLGSRERERYPPVGSTGMEDPQMDGYPPNNQNYDRNMLYDDDEEEDEDEEEYRNPITSNNDYDNESEEEERYQAEVKRRLEQSLADVRKMEEAAKAAEQESDDEEEAAEEDQNLNEPMVADSLDVDVNDRRDTQSGARFIEQPTPRREDDIGVPQERSDPEEEQFYGVPRKFSGQSKGRLGSSTLPRSADSSKKQSYIREQNQARIAKYGEQVDPKPDLDPTSDDPAVEEEVRVEYISEDSDNDEEHFVDEKGSPIDNQGRPLNHTNSATSLTLSEKRRQFVLKSRLPKPPSHPNSGDLPRRKYSGSRDSARGNVESARKKSGSSSRREVTPSASSLKQKPIPEQYHNTRPDYNVPPPSQEKISPPRSVVEQQPPPQQVVPPQQDYEAPQLMQQTPPVVNQIPQHFQTSPLQQVPQSTPQQHYQQSPPQVLQPSPQQQFVPSPPQHQQQQPFQQFPQGMQQQFQPPPQQQFQQQQQQQPYWQPAPYQQQPPDPQLQQYRPVPQPYQQPAQFPQQSQFAQPNPAYQQQDQYYQNPQTSPQNFQGYGPPPQSFPQQQFDPRFQQSPQRHPSFDDPSYNVMQRQEEFDRRGRQHGPPPQQWQLHPGQQGYQTEEPEDMYQEEMPDHYRGSVPVQDSATSHNDGRGNRPKKYKTPSPAKPPGPNFIDMNKSNLKREPQRKTYGEIHSKKMVTPPLNPHQPLPNISRESSSDVDPESVWAHRSKHLQITKSGQKPRNNKKPQQEPWTKQLVAEQRGSVPIRTQSESALNPQKKMAPVNPSPRTNPQKVNLDINVNIKRLDQSQEIDPENMDIDVQVTPRPDHYRNYDNPYMNPNVREPPPQNFGQPAYNRHARHGSGPTYAMGNVPPHVRRYSEDTDNYMSPRYADPGELSYNGVQNAHDFYEETPRLSYTHPMDQHVSSPYTVLPNIPPRDDRSVRTSQEGGYLARLQKKHQQPQYKQYTMKDYRNLKTEIRLGGLGPDSELIQEKQDKVNRAREYARQVGQQNRRVLNQQRPKVQQPGEVQDPNDLHSKRHVALEYAKKIHRPTPAPSQEGAGQSPESQRSPSKYSHLDEDMQKLEELQARHAREREEIDKLKHEVTTQS